jgi:hypothetical protein
MLRDYREKAQAWCVVLGARPYLLLRLLVPHHCCQARVHTLQKKQERKPCDIHCLQ